MNTSTMAYDLKEFELHRQRIQSKQERKQVKINEQCQQLAVMIDRLVNFQIGITKVQENHELGNSFEITFKYGVEWPLAKLSLVNI